MCSLRDRNPGGVVALCAVGLALFFCRRHKEKQRSRGDVYVSGKRGKRDDAEQSDFENGSAGAASVRLTEGPRSSGSAPPYSIGNSATVGDENGGVGSDLLPFTRPQRNGDYAPLDKNADALLEKLGLLYSDTERGSQRQQVCPGIPTQQAPVRSAPLFAGHMSLE